MLLNSRDNDNRRMQFNLHTPVVHFTSAAVQSITISVFEYFYMVIAPKWIGTVAGYPIMAAVISGIIVAVQNIL